MAANAIDERASARRAAGRLVGVADLILIVVSIVLAIGFALGVAVAVIGDTSSERWFGVGVALGAPLVWALTALPCFAAQALARYIEARTAA